jgi:hypothetical protein
MTRSACTKSLIVAALILLALGSAASAHDIWINKERRTNAAGEWCCNTFDCAVVPEEKIKDHAARLRSRQRGNHPPFERCDVGRHAVLAVPTPRQDNALFLLPAAFHVSGCSRGAAR